jgi:hypothetical protein
MLCHAEGIWHCPHSTQKPKQPHSFSRTVVFRSDLIKLQVIPIGLLTANFNSEMDGLPRKCAGGYKSWSLDLSRIAAGSVLHPPPPLLPCAETHLPRTTCMSLCGLRCWAPRGPVNDRGFVDNLCDSQRLHHAADPARPISRPPEPLTHPFSRPLPTPPSFLTLRSLR